MKCTEWLKQTRLLLITNGKIKYLLAELILLIKFINNHLKNNLMCLTKEFGKEYTNALNNKEEITK